LIELLFKKESVVFFILINDGGGSRLKD